MIDVIGYDGRPLAAGVAALVAKARIVVGGERNLAAFDLPDGARRIVLGAAGTTLDSAIAELCAVQTESVVVVASGDPTFFGVVRLLAGAGLELRVHPATSSVATAFARVGLSWDDAAVVSAHGRDVRPAHAVARARDKVAVLTGPADGGRAADIARVLLDSGHDVWVCQDLALPNEAVTPVTAGDVDRLPFSDLSVVVGHRPGDEPGRLGWLAGGGRDLEGWALPESEFTHRDSMITKTEVRALVVAWLGPRPGTTVWDIGSGSGSVAIECALLGADVVAVEQDGDSVERIRANAVAHHVSIDVVAGRFPEVALRGADAAFVGGGGLDAVRAVVKEASLRRVVATLAAVDRLAETLDLLAGNDFSVEATQVRGDRVERLPDGGWRLAATNPVIVVKGVRR